MKFTRAFVCAAIFAATLLSQPAYADNYLLINLVSYTSTESHKAIDYAKGELKKGRSVIVYLEEASVMAAAKSNAQQFQKQQRNLKELIANGAIVAVCPHCLKRYKIGEADLLNGVQVAEIRSE
jgi:intracellular sulfur oxidation DsrE/DsrF family protein